MKLDATAIDAALNEIWEIACERGRDAVISIKHDGRVYVQFEDVGGYVKESIRADLVGGGAHPSPGKALADFTQEMGAQRAEVLRLRSIWREASRACTLDPDNVGLRDDCAIKYAAFVSAAKDAAELGREMR